MRFLSIDIGSTYTKALLFDGFKPSQRHQILTNKSDLEESLNIMFEHFSIDESRDRVATSSSAKGGLRISAVGIVPDMTSKMAVQTAMGAGARVEQIFSYRLTQEDLKSLSGNNPDIILLSGGTDGGNKDILEYNIHALKPIDAFILFAGNRECRAVFEKCFAEKIAAGRASAADNILPELARPQPEACRDKIREIFLKEIAFQKGFRRTEILPTPMVFFDFCLKLKRSDLILIDLGGATCDVYSLCPPVSDPAVVFRGIQEAHTKRTVEGDLGLRVSSRNALESTDLLLKAKNETENIIHGNKEAFLPGWNPIRCEEKLAEMHFAAALSAAALSRHAGELTEFYSPAGKGWLQQGKDLRNVREIFFSGGYFQGDHEGFCEYFSEIPAGRLVPEHYHCSFDSQYQFIHIANLAREFPEEALSLACEMFSKNDGGVNA